LKIIYDKSKLVSFSRITNIYRTYLLEEAQLL